MSFDYFSWRRPASVAERRADAQRRIATAARRGKAMSPVALAGRTIARTFWGKAWCDNLERYRDFAYRLERGRSYVRSGSVIDLQIDAGQIRAKVAGSSVYDIEIDIDPVGAEAWRAIQRDCAGSISSRLDLLAGKLSDAVMSRLCADRIGLFPAPSAIRFTCSCPDYAIMCKHVAASMYGVGARFDHAPELLFTLRRASLDDLVTSALSEVPSGRPRSPRALVAGAGDGDLAALFGIELAGSAIRPGTRPAPTVKPVSAPGAAAPAAGAPKAKSARSGGAKASAASKARAKRRPAKPRSSRVPARSRSR